MFSIPSHYFRHNIDSQINLFNSLAENRTELMYPNTLGDNVNLSGN